MAAHNRLGRSPLGLSWILRGGGGCGWLGPGGRSGVDVEVVLDGQGEIKELEERDVSAILPAPAKSRLPSTRDSFQLYIKEASRFPLLKPDEDNHSNVVVLNHKAATELLGRSNVVGEKIRLKGTPFRTFSGGAFVGGYSDHYPTYIVVSK